MNEVNAKIRAGPRGRSQRQNPEQMVQTLHERTSQNGMGPKEETTAAEDCEFPHGKALHLTDKCGQIRTNADKFGQMQTNADNTLANCCTFASRKGNSLCSPKSQPDTR